MKTITYEECIAHLRANKEFIRIGAIAKRININGGLLRNIVSQNQHYRELPVKYRADFINVILEITNIRQVETNEGGTISDAIDLFYRSREGIE